MTTQRTFLTDGLSERYSLPESPGGGGRTTADERFARFCGCHPWFVAFCARYLLERAKTEKRVSIKSAFEEARKSCSQQLGERIPGVGVVGLDNSYYRLAALAVLKLAPELQGKLIVRSE